MISAVLTPLFSLLYALAFVVLFSLLEWCLGRVFWSFNATKMFGFLMMARSGFFVKELPHFCPKSTCVDGCKTWTCPRRH